MIQRLIRQADDIGHLFFLCERAHLVELATTADEAKDNRAIAGQVFRREDRREKAQYQILNELEEGSGRKLRPYAVHIPLLLRPLF